MFVQTFFARKDKQASNKKAGKELRKKGNGLRMEMEYQI